MRRTWLVAFALIALGCGAGGAGAESSPRPPQAKRAPDPDTQALAPEPTPKIPDPIGRLSGDAGAEAPGIVAQAEAEVAPPPEAAAEPEAAPAPSAAAKKPKPAAPAATPAAPDCGSKDNPCPMQKLMKTTMARASSAESLEAAFKQVAGMSPNAGWQWKAISSKGAELAKAGDVAGAKKQCKACHDLYRAPYKAQFRARKL